MEIEEKCREELRKVASEIMSWIRYAALYQEAPTPKDQKYLEKELAELLECATLKKS